MCSSMSLIFLKKILINMPLALYDLYPIPNYLVIIIEGKPKGEKVEWTNVFCQ